MKSILAKILGVIGLIYLLNPTAGFIELIPDALPLVGNLDEAGATLLVINALKELGYDFTNLFGKKKELPSGNTD